MYHCHNSIARVLTLVLLCHNDMVETTQGFGGGTPWRKNSPQIFKLSSVIPWQHTNLPYVHVLLKTVDIS